VRSIAVQTTAIPLTALQVKPPRVYTFRSVEASLRVDALASAGFRMSRSKLADMISGGDVRVNWKEVTKNGLCLKTGDVVSVSGKGRIEVGEITMTKKGRYAVELTRFL
jgi:RNA-binding protein YlmH